MKGKQAFSVCSSVLVTALLAVAQLPVGSASADESFQCFGREATVVGTPGPDRFEYAEPDDIDDFRADSPEIFWFTTKDVVVARGGDDQIHAADFTKSGPPIYACGNQGSDEMGLDGNEEAFFAGNRGNDVLSAAAGDFSYLAPVHLRGGSGSDLIQGASVGSDVLIGGRGNDQIDGRPGGDDIQGGEGDDLIGGDEGQDLIHGGPGNDRIRGEGHADLIRGGIGRDRITGQQGFDRLFGGPGSDRLKGNNGYDRANGGPGRDRCRAERKWRCEF